MPFSGQVMLVEVNGAPDSYAQLDIPSNPDESYTDFEIFFPQASLDAWQAGAFSPDFWEYLTFGESYSASCWIQYVGGEWKWACGNGTPAGTVFGDQVYAIRISTDINAQTVVLNVDGSDVVTSTDTLSTLAHIFVGLALASDTASVYYDNVKISALAPGGSELLDADFETAIVPPFDSITGDVSLADAPEGSEGPDVRDPFGLGRFYEAPPWRFIVTDLDGVILTYLDHLAFQRTVTFTRGQPTVIDTGIPSDNPEVNIDADDGDPFVAEGNRLVYAFRRDGGAVPWHIQASGLVMGVRDNANSDVAITTVTAYDSRQLLHRRAVLKDATGELPDDDFGLTYVGQTAAEIIVEQLDLMEFWQTGPLPSAGLDWGQTYFYEGTIEVTPEITTITFPRGTSIGEMIGKLEETGTCEVSIRAIWDPVNRPGILGELSIFERAGSQRNAAVFGYDTFPKNLVGLDRLVDGRERANEVQFYAGQGGPPVPRYADVTSNAKFGEYFAQQFFPGQISEAAVESMAQRVLTLQKNGQKTYALSPAAERAPIPLTDYRVFDDVPVYASRIFRDPVATFLRVESIPIIIGDDQLERVTGLLVAVDPELVLGTGDAVVGGGGGDPADFGPGAAASWRPFAASSPFNKVIPADPSLAAESAAIVAKVTGWGDPTEIPLGVASSTLSPTSDYDHPLYFSQPTDPLYTIGPTGDAYSGWSDRYGTQIRIPDGARGANGSDAHLTVIDIDGNTEWDFYHFQYTDPDREVPAGGGSIIAKAGSAESLGGDGVVNNPYGGANVPTDAAGFCLSAGVIRPEELIAGEINHALSMLVHSTDGTYVVPAVGTAGSVDPTDAPPDGARFWLDMTFAEIEALTADDYLKTIWKAMSKYGMYVRDTGSASWYVSLSGGYPYILAGDPDPWREFAVDNGIAYSAGDDYYLLDLAPGVAGTNHPDYAAKLRVLDWTDPANR